MDREQYEKDLAERQKRHLEKVSSQWQKNIAGYKPKWRPCAHNQCTSCHGTGTKSNGQRCIHMISCLCPRCTPGM